MKKKQDTLLSKIQEQEYKVLESQKKREDELRSRHNLDVIKRTDRFENVKRIQQMNEYQKDKLLERIIVDTEKANRIK